MDAAAKDAIDSLVHGQLGPAIRGIPGGRTDAITGGFGELQRDLQTAINNMFSELQQTYEGALAGAEQAGATVASKVPVVGGSLASPLEQGAISTLILSDLQRSGVNAASASAAMEHTVVHDVSGNITVTLNGTSLKGLNQSDINTLANQVATQIISKFKLRTSKAAIGG